MMKLTIRKKVLFCSLIPLLLLGGIILLIASTIVKGAIIDQVENSLKGTAIATQAAYDQNAGTYLQTENGDIWKGSYNISQSENLVDTIKQESGMDVTFFYGSQRIMTSAVDKNGDRIGWHHILWLLCSGISERRQRYSDRYGVCRGGETGNLPQRDTDH